MGLAILTFGGARAAYAMGKPASDNTLNFSNLERRLRSAQKRGDTLAEMLLPLVLGFCAETPTLASLVPLIFHYGGEPLSLEDHPMMEPLFNLFRTPQTLLLCSRQVGKSMTMTMLAWLDALWTAHYNGLFVSPFYEQTRRISTDYFAALQEQSPLRSFFHGRGCVKQVLERTLPNGSRLRFTYACRTADRARGIHANSLWLDERQLMHEGVKTVLEATMAAAKDGKYTMAAGTPLTNANIASQEFKEQSSRSHWMIPCRACRKENIAALEYDLVQMIGPWHPNISRDRPAILCAGCRYPLFPWDGRYIHLQPQFRDSFLGLHVPMIVLPMHCCNAKKWSDFIKVFTDSRVPEHQKFNEYLGVPYDDGVALLTEADIDACHKLGANRLTDVIARLSEYNGRIAVGVDWGGGGMTKESLTKISVVGLHWTGRLDVLFGLAIKQRIPRVKEAEIVWTIVKAVKPQVFAHDDASVGDACEEMLLQLGMPREIIMPMTYVGQTGGLIMNANPISESRPKRIWSVDKARGLLHFVQAVKTGNVAFFDPAIQGLGARDLLLDLTHLRVEEVKTINFSRSEAIIIGRETGQSDDFAHACHFAANALWALHGWPKLAQPLLLTTIQDLTSYVSELNRCLDPESLEALISKAEAEFAQAT